MQTLSQTDIFVKNAAKTRDNLYYPQFHVAAEYGWINDPNGLIYMDGKYHFFFQHYPFKPVWGPMHWGHVVSKDLVHWEHLPIALYPDQDYDRNGCYSGSAVNNNGVLTLIYTGNVYLGKPGDDAHIRQVQCMATSTDGINFTKHGPVLLPPEGIMHFRDPKVWRARGKWWMVVGAKLNNLGQVRLYQSDTLTEWEFVRIVDRAKDSSEGYMWECPDFFNVNHKDILVTSPQGIPAQGYNYRNLHQSGYRSGKWEQDTSFTIDTEFQVLDHGHDFYAPQSFEAADGRRIMVGWMEMWNAPMPNQAEGWSGAFTLPREVSYKEHGKLYCKPIAELEQLRTEYKGYKPFTVNDETISLNDDYQELKLSFDLASSTGERYGLAIGKAGRIYVDTQASRLVFERYSDINELKGCRSIPLEAVSKVDLHIFIDRSSVEVFVNDGEYSITSKIYPHLGQKEQSLFAEKGTGVVTNLEAWKLGAIFPAEA